MCFLFPITKLHLKAPLGVTRLLTCHVLRSRGPGTMPGLLEKGSFQRGPFSREIRDSELEVLESPQTVETKKNPTISLEILENFEILEISP